MKIAKVFNGDPNNRKGYFNNVIERTKHLINVESNVDCYLIRRSYPLSVRLLKRQLKLYQTKPEYTVIDNIRFKNIWISPGVIDYIISHRLNIRLVQNSKQLSRYLNTFKDYDVISSHGIEANYLSMLINKKFGIPYVPTWHGSDINIRPFKSFFIKHQVREILDNAFHNFFVSKNLLDTSQKISKGKNKSTLYTGPSESFVKYSSSEKQHLRQNLGIQTKYVVGYIGNFEPIKNITILPTIFKKIQENIDQVSFVLVGNGSLENELQTQINNTDVSNVHLLGKKPPSAMPDIMNCLDLLILPSLNEGMPRAILEALACGVPVVGSNRGGIPEVLNNNNIFQLDDNFIENISFRAIEILTSNNLNVKLPEKFSWDHAVEQELKVYNDALS